LIKPIQYLVGKRLRIKDDIKEIKVVEKEANSEYLYGLIEELNFELKQVEEAIEVLEEYFENTIK